jgi:hypothetical protein
LQDEKFWLAGRSLEAKDKRKEKKSNTREVGEDRRERKEKRVQK